MTDASPPSPAGRAPLVSLEGLARHFKNTSWLMAAQVVRLGVSFFVGIYVARYLGPARYGVYGNAVAVIMLFASLATLGVDQILLRELVARPQIKPKLIGTAFWLKVLGGVIMIPAAYVFVSVVGTGAQSQRAILLVSGVLLLQAFDVFTVALQADVRGRAVAISNSISLLVGGALKIWLISAHADVEWFLGAVVAERIVLAINLLISNRDAVPTSITQRPHVDTVKMFISHGWPILLSAVAIAVYLRIDLIMIARMLGPRATGLYAAVTQLSESWYVIPVVICQALFPSIVRVRLQDEKLYNKRIAALYGLLFWIFFSIGAIISVSANLLVPFILGKSYAAAGPVLVIHIWAGVFVAYGTISRQALNAEGRNIILTVTTIAGAIVNVLLNLVLIPTMGIRGSAIATIISYALAGYVGLFFFPASRDKFFAMTLAPFTFIAMLVRHVRPARTAHAGGLSDDR